jgi:hypothetical protein
MLEKDPLDVVINISGHSIGRDGGGPTAICDDLLSQAVRQNGKNRRHRLGVAYRAFEIV